MAVADLQKQRKKKDPGLTFQGLMARSSWQPLPHVSVLGGDARFLKELLVKRFAKERFQAAAPELRRFEGAARDRSATELPLATVLDELRTPSFFSPYRLVIVDNGDAFLAAHGESLLPFLKSGFSGGHLLLLVSRLDQRTRFARHLAEHGWSVHCPQPFDRPPPWQTTSPVWESELSQWLVGQARDKGLELDLQTAFLLHDRAGTDLAVLDEELEKLATFCGRSHSKRVTSAVIDAVVADVREDSVFILAEHFLEGRRADALAALERLLEKGYHTERGTLTIEPSAIALLFAGVLIPRLRALRRAHAMAHAGAGPDEWLAAGIVQRPFLPRFQRQLRAVSPGRLVRLFDRLYDLDKALKSGGNPLELLELFVAQHAVSG